MPDSAPVFSRVRLNRSRDHLSVTQGVLRSLEGLQASPLDHLELAHLPRLWSLAGVPPSLRTFRAERCPMVTDLQPLVRATGLETLVLSDCGVIRSLAPLARLDGLNRLVLTGDTRIDDGDLLPVWDIPEVIFSDRRGYNLTREDFRRRA